MREDFIFDGKYGSDFGLKLCNINGDPGFETITVSNTEFETFQPGNLEKNYFTGSRHNSVLTKTIQVCKVINCNMVQLTEYDIEEISRWLCRDDGYHKFAFINDTDNTVEYNAKIDMNVIETQERVIALELTITTDSPFGYTIKKNSFSLNNDETIYIIDNSSNIGEMPIELKLTCKSDGDYIITSTFNNIKRNIHINNCTSGEIITISDMCVITTSLPSHDITDDFNYVFPKLYNTISEQRNEFYVNLPCDLTILYKIKRKVGI